MLREQGCRELSISMKREEELKKKGSRDVA